MRSLLAFFFLFCVQIACTPKKLDNKTESLIAYSKRTIPLKNGLGTVEVSLPEELDSSYNRISYSDAGECSNEFRYRFTHSKYSALAETGFIYLK